MDAFSDTNSFRVEQFNQQVAKYKDLATHSSVWNSEKFLYKKYLEEGNIVDVGCGAGRLFNFFSEEFPSSTITGLDFASEMVTAASEYAQKIESATVALANALHLPITSNTINSTIFSHNGLFTIPKLSNRRKVIEEISRVTVSRGRLIFTSPILFDLDTNKEPLKGLETGDRICSEDGVEVFIHIPTDEEIEKMLSNQFFLIDRIERSDFRENSYTEKYTGNCVFWIAEKQDTK